MIDINLYQYRVQHINRYMSLLRKLSHITDFYIVIIIIVSLYNIFWTITKLIDIANFELSIDYYSCIMLWAYLLFTVANIISYIFAIAYNNYKKKWFYVVTLFIIALLSGFMLIVENLTIKHNLIRMLRDHYLITNDHDNTFSWKNFTFKMACTKYTEQVIAYEPEECIKYTADFLITIYTYLYYNIIHVFIVSSALLVFIVLNLLLHYKLILAYKIVRVQNE